MKYRKPNRLEYFDYSSSGFYFVTLCVKNHENLLGEIVDDVMVLSKEGEIVNDKIKWLNNHFSRIEIIEYVVMPNHVHIIISLNYENVGTGRDLSLQKHKPLSEIIGAFKTVSSKEIHNSGFTDFQWQRSFYDRIIRSEKELENIRNYIFLNPINWKKDKYY